MAKAQMLPNAALKAVRGATSASPRSWVTGWWPPRSVEPRRSTSALRSRAGQPWAHVGTPGLLGSDDGVRGLRQGSDRLLRGAGRNNSRDWWLAHKPRYEDEIRRPMEQLLQDVGADGRGQAVPPQPRHPLLEGQVALQDQHRRGDLRTGGGSVYLRSRRRASTSVAGATTSTAHNWPATGRPSPTSAPRPGSKASPPPFGRPRPTYASHAAKTAPRGFTADHPRSTCSARTASSGSGPTARQAAWLHTASAERRPRRGGATLPAAQRLVGLPHVSGTGHRTPLRGGSAGGEVADGLARVDAERQDRQRRAW